MALGIAMIFFGTVLLSIVHGTLKLIERTRWYKQNNYIHGLDSQFTTMRKVAVYTLGAIVAFGVTCCVLSLSASVFCLLVGGCK